MRGASASNRGEPAQATRCVLLLLGTDASAPGMHPGWSALLELEELATAGLTPFEALSAGTRNGTWLERNVPDARRVDPPAAPIILIAVPIAQLAASIAIERATD